MKTSTEYIELTENVEWGYPTDAIIGGVNAILAVAAATIEQNLILDCVVDTLKEIQAAKGWYVD